MARFRIRGPAGQSTALLDDTATIRDLKSKITEATGLTYFEIKYGYPPKPLDFSDRDSSTLLAQLGLSINGEQFTITEKPLVQPDNLVPHITEPRKDPLLLQRQRNQMESDPPEIPSPEHDGTVVLRVMPDDNSCLFRSVGSAVIGDIDTMTELRSIVAQTIQANPELYSEAVLDKPPDDYCRWIQSENSWGGGIELSILSQHFNLEICSIDVQTLRFDRFNQGQPRMCIVVYSGIHYDTIALSPSEYPHAHADVPPDFDTKVFDSRDSILLERAVELCGILRSKHYFTDTSSFRIRCNVCGGMFTGEKGATNHAAGTGHYDFGEAL